MSKVNPTLKRSSMDDVVRLAGGAGLKAAKQPNIQLLRRITLANLLWEDCAYVDGKSIADEIVRLIPLCSPSDVAALAVECRLVQKLRHTPLFIISEMCKHDEHRALVGSLLPKVITRADMITDFLAIYWKEGKRPLANQVKKGLAESFHNFDEYQFAKYDRDAAIKLRDVMFLVHPKANDEQEQELFNRIAERNLTTPDTWEVALSAGKDKKETWTRLIETGKIGGMAMLRNLVTSLLENGKISTTVTRAKEVRCMAEKMITLGKKNTLHTRRQALAYITKEDVVKKVFDELAPKYAERNGGYTQIYKLGPRRGDGAEMAIVKLIDYVKPVADKKAAKKAEIEAKFFELVADAKAKAKDPNTIIG